MADKKINFKKWDQEVEKIYGNEENLRKKVEHRGLSRKLRTIQTKDDLKDNLDFSLEKPSEIAEASRTLFALDSNYAKIISYYADMFYARYTITPEVMDAADLTSENYLETYEEIVAKADGMNIETLLPDVLREVFTSGSIYMYAEANDAAETTTFRFLPNEYCRTIFGTNFGTSVIEFNFEYFDQFRNEDDFELVMGSFPKEFSLLYSQYEKNKRNPWIQLDPSVSSSILANEYGIPPFINALIGILEYEDTRGVELEKAHRELQQILIHRIPIEDGQPIFDIDEVASIQRAISTITRNHKGLETITAFGQTDLHRLQEEPNRENRRIGQAHRSIFNSAGLNSAYFADESKEALLISRSIDKGMVWDYIQQLNAFLNLTINNLYDFKNMQAIIKILPITIHEEAETVKLFRENASFGIGKLDAIVAAGIKQKDLVHAIKLEQELGLDKLLTPLQSSHTQSGGETGDAVEDTVKEEGVESNDDTSKEEVDNSEEHI